MSNEQIASDLEDLRDALIGRMDVLVRAYHHESRPDVVQRAIHGLGDQINEIDGALMEHEEHGAFEAPEREPASLDHRTSAPGGR